MAYLNEDGVYHDFPNAYGDPIENVRFEGAQYANNGRIAMRVYCNDDDYWEPYTSLTVNLDGPCDSKQAYLDTNHLANEVPAWLEKHGIAQIHEDFVWSGGFCAYPLMTFNDEFLAKTMPSYAQEIGIEVEIPKYGVMERPEPDVSSVKTDETQECDYADEIPY